MKNKITPILIWIFFMLLSFGFLKVLNHNISMPDAPSTSIQRGEYLRKMLADPITGKIPNWSRKNDLIFSHSLSNNQLKSAPTQYWENIGPYNVGGRTRALAMDIDNENILLAGAASGGMWRSENKGENWQFISGNSDLLSVTCIQQDTRPTKKHIWYYGTGEGAGGSAGASNAFYLGNGLFKSTDGGLSFQALSSTQENNPESFTGLGSWQIVWNLACAPVDTADIVYAALLGRLDRSLDGGQTWQTVINGSSYYTDVAISSQNIGYASFSSDGATKGIWRMNNDQWTNITSNNFPNTYNRVVIGIDPNDENTVYFLANTPGFGQHSEIFFGEEEYNSLWKYEYQSGDGTDTGGIWTDLSTFLPNNGLPFDNFNAQGSYNLVIKVQPGNSDVVLFGGTNLYRTTDGFTNPSNIQQIGGYKKQTQWPDFEIFDNQHPDQHGIVFNPNSPAEVLTSTDGGIYLCNNINDGQISWTSLNNGFTTGQLYAVAMDRYTPGSQEVAGGFQDFGSWYTNTHNPNANWTFPSTGDGAFCAIADEGKNHYFSRQNGHVLKVKLDGEGNSTGYKRIDPSGGRNYLFINPFILDPKESNTMYVAGGSKVWRNALLNALPIDNQYDSISDGWWAYTDSLSYPNMQISALACSYQSPDVLYVGSSNRFLYKIENPENQNSPWINITGNWPSGAYINCIAVDPNNSNRIGIVISNYNTYSLFFSENGGGAWDKIGGNLEPNSFGSGPGPSMRWLEIIPTKDDSTIYLLGTSIGLFSCSKLNGTSTQWVQQGQNEIGNCVVTMIKNRPSDGMTLIATHGRGVFKSRMSHSWDANTTENVIVHKQSMYFYPNPCFGEKTININSQKTLGHCTLYNSNGRIIRKFYAPSTQNQLNVEELNSGIYFLKSDNSPEKLGRLIIVK